MRRRGGLWAPASIRESGTYDSGFAVARVGEERRGKGGLQPLYPATFGTTVKLGHTLSSVNPTLGIV